MKIHSIVVSLALAACSTAAAPKALVDARAAHARARADAASTAPSDFHEASRALARAERAYLDDGDSAWTRDLSYVAQRKSQEAAARGRTVTASLHGLAAQEQIAAIEAARQRRTERELSMTQERLSSASAQAREHARRADDERAARIAREAELGAELGAEQAARMAREAELASEIERERQATADAQRQTQAAVESLREIANVREEARGTVLTLSGSVLFATGMSTLLPIARQHLDQVAAMLRDSGDKRFVVEGHTDARGSATRNEELSQMRAAAVRDYLVSRGVPADRIRAEGFGSRRPATDNATPEGRANNRRVEIVIEPAEASAR